MARNRIKKPDEHAETNGVATEPPPTDNLPETNGPPPENGTTPPPVQNGTPAGTNRPCKAFSCPVGAGVCVEAAIWPREILIDKKPVTVYAATVRKTYRKDDGSYGNTNFLRGSEIPIAVHVMSLAATWMMAQRTEEDPPF